MALTDLTIPRRQVLALDFSDSTQISGTAASSVMFAYSSDNPFPIISAMTANVAPDDPDVATGDEPRHGALLLNGANEFGFYFPSAVNPGFRSSVSSGAGSLSADLTEFVLTIDAGHALDSPPTISHKSVPVDLDNVTAGSSYFPVDGDIVYQTGTARPSAATIAPVFTFGLGILGYDITGGEVYASDIDGTWSKAFENDGDFEAGFLNAPVTTNDGTYNYTTVWKQPVSGSNSVFMSKWQPAGLLDPFDYTNYRIVLDDAADDIVFQNAADINFGGTMRIRGNTRLTFVTVDLTEEFMTEMTVFVFANDFSYYDRLDITSNGDLFNAVYFRDINGLHYLVGGDIDNKQSFQILAGDDGGGGGGGGDGLEDLSVRIRVWGYGLDGHKHIVWRVGPSETLVFDPTTGQWASYASPGRDNWRAHVGQNWIGMSTDTLARGFGSDVVAGDDSSGVLFILDPTVGRDDRATTGDDPFNRVVTGGLSLSGRETIPCGALQLTCSVGSPSQAGASFTLETSDDWGATWVDHGSVTITDGDFSLPVEWRGLGTAGAPGRIFRLTDNGAAVRVSGADLR